MAWSDYPNTAAPSNWDETRSGFIPVSIVQDYGEEAGDEELAWAVDARTHTLAEGWTGSVYDPYGLSFPSSSILFLVPNEPIELPEFAAEVFLNVSTPRFALWDASGTIIDSSPSVLPDPVAPGNPQVYEWPNAASFPLQNWPLTVSGIAIFSANSAQPLRQILGIHGPGPSTPPVPVPFWTAFNRTQELL